MRHAIVSDVHANLEALEAVLADIVVRGAADTVCLGDFVGYGASPNDCIALLRPRIATAVLGNHDLAALDPATLENFNPEAAAAARWTAAALTREHADYLRSLPFSVAWRGARLVHASPAEPAQWNYVFSPAEAVDEMSTCEESVCFVGHSHFPGTFEVIGPRATYTRDAHIVGQRDRRQLIVVPSVGQPRDGDPRTGYLLWDDKAWTFDHVRLDYDIEGAMRRIRAAGLPPHLADRLLWGE
jgi:diadenosine tetraphosphatase ApaH/serine/threonine PP2A family protein phosphatase